MLNVYFIHAHFFFFVLKMELPMSCEGTTDIIMENYSIENKSSFLYDVNLRKIEVGKTDVFIKKLLCACDELVSTRFK